jgi:hypothetical protein
MLLKNKKNIFLLPIVALLVSSAASAHTEFKGQAFEGTSADNAVTIGHACEASGKPIIAQSVVIPGDNPILTTSDGSPIADLSEAIEQGSIAGLVDLIQSRDIFLVQKEKHDLNGNVTGFYGKTGLLDVEAQGRVPFAFTAPNFVTTSCVKKLNIEAAIADICVLTKPTIQATKVNLWIPANGSQYAIKGAAAGVDGVGEAPTLQVNRDLTNNPLDPSCGAGIDLTVTPSALDIDTNLGIPGTWSK